VTTGHLGKITDAICTVALVLPAIFSSAAKEDVENKILHLSRGTAILLLLAYIMYAWSILKVVLWLILVALFSFR
jgi:Ca2+/H+ antiporter